MTTTPIEGADVDPYEVLGVTTDATMAEIETRYRLLLREYHPDLHHHEGADAVAFAEATTRNLNSAMDQLRRSGATGSQRPGAWANPSRHGTRRDTGPSDRQWPGENPFWRPPPDERDADPAPPAGGANYYGPQSAEWFGDPVDHDPNEPVPCPFCGRPYVRLDDYEHHLEQVHKYRRIAPRPPKPKSRFVITLGKLRFVPLWLLVPIAFANWGMFGFGSFTATLALVLLVLWTQTSPRFRDY